MKVSYLPLVIRFLTFGLALFVYASGKYCLYYRVISKRIQQLKVIESETDTSSEDDDTETDEGYDAEYSNTSSEEEDDDPE